MTKEVKSYSLSRLDVIMSPHFVYGERSKSSQPTKVGYEKPPLDRNHSDPNRATAKYMVLSVASDPEDRTCLSNPRKVTAQRLNDDGSHNPEGELIIFNADLDDFEPDIEVVTLVGRMELRFVPLA